MTECGVFLSMNTREGAPGPDGLVKRAIDQAPVGVTIADARRSDTPLVYANDRFVEMTGYDREELLGVNCRFLQGEDTDLDTVEELSAAIDAEKPITVTLCNYRKDETMFHNEVTVAPIRDEAGEVTHYVGFQRDVTDS